MNTPETQSPIDTTDIPIDNIGNRETLRKKGSALTNETQLRDGPVQRSAAEQNPAVFAAADSFGCVAAAVQRGGGVGVPEPAAAAGAGRYCPGNADVPPSGLYAVAKGLVPEGLTVDGLDYRETAGDPLPTIPEPKALYLAARQGMATSDFSGVTLLLPKNAGLGELADQINSAWQKECSLFFSVEEVEQDEFDARIAAGKYTIALAPIRAEGGSVYQSCSNSPAEGGSLTGYADTVYADRLALSAQQTGKDRCALLAQCERQLLESCTVVPLLAQQKRLLLANGVRDLVFDPFFPVLDLTWAKMS